MNYILEYSIFESHDVNISHFVGDILSEMIEDGLINYLIIKNRSNEMIISIYNVDEDLDDWEVSVFAWCEVGRHIDELISQLSDEYHDYEILCQLDLECSDGSILSSDIFDDWSDNGNISELTNEDGSIKREYSSLNIIHQIKIKFTK